METMNSPQARAGRRVAVLDDWLAQLGDLTKPNTRTEILANAVQEQARSTEHGQTSAVASVMDTPTFPEGLDESEDDEVDPSDPWAWLKTPPRPMLADEGGY